MIGTTLPIGYGPLDGAAASGDATTLQGRPIDATAPLATEVLAWDGAQWTPTAAGVPAAHAASHAPQAGADALTTAIAGAIQVGDSAAVGTANSLARSDHAHSLAAPAAPADTTKAAASAGVGTSPARADHKHDITTAAAVELTDATNAEGAGTTLARAAHTHAHGNRGGGALHADVIGAGADGFMTGADKTILDNLKLAQDDTNGAPNGFVDRTDSTWTFTDGTLTFAIQPVGANYAIYSNGVKYTKSGVESVPITDTEGTWFTYFDGAGVLQATQSFTTALILQYCIAGIFYWDATNKVALLEAEERHGMVMSPETHLYLHQILGAQWSSGLALADFSVDGTGDDAVNAQFSVSDGLIYDEDLAIAITDGAPQDLAPTANIPIFYREGALGVWRRKTADTFPICYNGAPVGYAGTYAPYNEWTGAVWQLTSITNNQFLLMHYYATNDVVWPVIGIVGQEDYNLLAAAREGATAELKALRLAGLPNSEFTPIATVIFQVGSAYGNTPKARVRSLDASNNYVDWRNTTGGAGGAGTDLVPHASTHLPAGTDPIVTAAPVTITTANAEGADESLARSDHEHAITSGAPSDQDVLTYVLATTNWLPQSVLRQDDVIKLAWIFAD